MGRHRSPRGPTPERVSLTRLRYRPWWRCPGTWWAPRPQNRIELFRKPGLIHKIADQSLFLVSRRFSW